MLFNRQPPGVSLKSREELQAMRRASQLTSECLEYICAHAKPGVPTQDLDDLQMEFARRHGVTPAPLNYRGFPKSVCTSINEVICHGIPNTREVLKQGDIVGIDCSLIVDGFFGDTAATIPVGDVSESTARLLWATLYSLKHAIDVVRPGATLGDIGHAIQSYVEPLGYSVVRDFVGHGIGRSFHEPPQVTHYGLPGKGLKLRAGMTFTIEPMINHGTYRCRMLDDGWTAVTLDGKNSAQFEHTIAVTDSGVEILSVTNGEGAWEAPGRVVMPPEPADLTRID